MESSGRSVFVENIPERGSRVRNDEKPDADVGVNGMSLRTILSEKQHSPSSSSLLVSTHKAVLRAMTEPDLNPMKARLSKLRRRRIALAGMIKERESSRTQVSVGHELYLLKNSLSSEKDRPYLQRIPHRGKASRDTAKKPESELMDSAINEQRLSQRMRVLRLRRKLAAAYRLSGISFLPCSEDIMALRFDICVQGVFVNCFFAFFDIVSAEEGKGIENSGDTDSQDGSDIENKLYLRLSQHTLPASIPLSAIIQETLGGGACLGSTVDRCDTIVVLDKLRHCAQRLYNACYCYSIRQNNVRILESLQAKDSANLAGRQYIVNKIQASDSLDRVSFHIMLLSGTCSLSIELLYREPNRTLPNIVTAKNLTHSNGVPRRRRQQQHQQWPAISDTDDSELHTPTDDLIDSATTAFRQQPIDAALKVVEESMLDW